MFSARGPANHQNCGAREEVNTGTIQRRAGMAERRDASATESGLGLRLFNRRPSYGQLGPVPKDLVSDCSLSCLCRSRQRRVRQIDAQQNRQPK